MLIFRGLGIVGVVWGDFLLDHPPCVQGLLRSDFVDAKSCRWSCWRINHKEEECEMNAQYACMARLIATRTGVGSIKVCNRPDLGEPLR